MLFFCLRVCPDVHCLWFCYHTHIATQLENDMSKQIEQIKEAWHYIYGSGSETNLAGKILLGVPLFPVVAVMVLTWIVCDALFTKKRA